MKNNLNTNVVEKSKISLFVEKHQNVLINIAGIISTIIFFAVIFTSNVLGLNIDRDIQNFSIHLDQIWSPLYSVSEILILYFTKLFGNPFLASSFLVIVIRLFTIKQAIKGAMAQKMSSGSSEYAGKINKFFDGVEKGTDILQKKSVYQFQINKRFTKNINGMGAGASLLAYLPIMFIFPISRTILEHTHGTILGYDYNQPNIYFLILWLFPILFSTFSNWDSIKNNSQMKTTVVIMPFIFLWMFSSQKVYMVASIIATWLMQGWINVFIFQYYIKKHKPENV